MPVKEKIMNNFSLKVLAAVLALAVWFIVNNIDDPVGSKTFKNVVVEVQNADAISSLNKVYEVKSGGIINVTVSAKQSVLRKIVASDIVAVADLNNLSLTNAVSIQLSCPKYENVSLKSDIDMLSITLEDEETQQFKVDVTTIGAPADGYALGEVKVRPNLIKVSGAQTQIERISEVRVEVDVSNATENFSKRVEPKAYDANGKLMDAKNLVFSSETVKVSVEVNETKTVPILVTTEGTPMAGYHVISVEYEPKEIVITGAQEALRACTSIPIEYNVSNRTTDVETEIALSDYLPQGISVVGDVTNINLQITISKQELQKVSIPLSSVQFRNLGDGLVASMAEGGTIEVSAIWSATDINRTIQPSDFTVYVDCEKLEVGTHTLPLQFDKSNDIIVKSDVTVRILIEEEKGKIEETTEPEKTEPATEPPTEEEETEEQEEEESEKEKD